MTENIIKKGSIKKEEFGTIVLRIWTVNGFISQVDLKNMRKH